MAKYIKKLLSLVLIIGGLLGCGGLALAANVSQGYSSTKTLPSGSVVSLENNSLTLATLQNSSSLIGVVVTPGDYLLNVDANKTTQVVSNGTAITFVSDINGEVHVGDKLALSPIAGVAMRSTEPGKVLGIAKTNVDSSNPIQTTTVKDRYGQEKTVHIGNVTADISIVDYQLGTSNNNAIVSGLQSIASNATGKQVTPLRAILAALVLVLALVISVIVLYSSVSSSIRSIGRNPLSKRFVVQGLIEVIVAVFIIMIAAFSVVYIIIGS